MQTGVGAGTPRTISSTYCPFCTDANFLLHATQEQDPDVVNAFSLSNLLPSGTITVAVHDGESPCPGASNSADWRPLPLRNLSARPADTLFRELAFLEEHLFLRAVCRLGLSGRIIFIRIYLIPNDLQNVSGRLHHRHDSIVKEARRHMRNVVSLIEQNADMWDADETGLNAPPSHTLPSYIDNRTMAEIYSDLPSPELSPPTNDETRLSHCIAAGDAIWGLRTTLYSYQRHSVAVMLYRESSTGSVPDPTYVTVSCMSGIPFYIQPSTMTVLRDCPMFSPPQAGILCEELGTGKTVMIIALILASVNQLANPEESHVDERPVMTPLAYHHFPSREHALARDRAGLGRRVIRQIPSLVEVLVHYFSLSKDALGPPKFADDLEATHLWPFIRANKPFYHHFDTDIAADVLKRSRRRLAPNLSPRTMYLSSATLVIVPLTLLGQWKGEIDKHCHDCVRYLVIRPSMELPDARTLASDYQLVIMSDTRFRAESRKNNTEKLYDLKPCTCPSLNAFRVPDCHCPGDPEVTPLLQVRWKRLVIDEGHVAGNMAATINYFVRKLSIQHKWIVTGTPTSNILGLQLGRTTDEHGSDQYADVDDLYSDLNSVNAMSAPVQDDECYVRVWGSYDSHNLRKLGTMIGDFIAVPQFRADPKSFAIHVSAPLCDQRGPQPGAIKVLSQVMQTVMVRHRVEDVENDVLLPPMAHDIIYMELDNYALKSYNAMQASLAINAIDAEREGPDYLFNPRNAKELQTAINNSLQGLFWSSSDFLYNVDEICRLADKHTDRAKRSKKISPQDLDLLQQALEHSATAANDDIWRGMQPHPDVPFKVTGLDPVVLEAWTRDGLCNGSQTIHLMHSDRLVQLRSLVRRTPLIPKNSLIEEGKSLEWRERMAMDSTSKSSCEVKQANQSKELAKDVQDTIEVLKNHARWMGASDNEELERNKIDQISSTEATTTCVTTSSHLSRVKVGPSLSTKLNYILSEILQYSAKEKFLVFSSSVLTLYQIGEALSLFEIKYLRYTNEAKYKLREQSITTFETSDTHRVLLMELKLGARGLNLISASRVIFCEPVWHPDIESQAIKRVHRIGQTRPVTVKTLVIRSTAEEAMITRRRYLRGSDKVPNMTTDSGMRDYLQHPRFLSESVSSNSESIGVVLSLDDNHTVSVGMQCNLSGEERGVGRVDVESDSLVDRSEAGNGDGGRTARKRVRFE